MAQSLAWLLGSPQQVNRKNQREKFIRRALELQLRKCLARDAAQKYRTIRCYKALLPHERSDIPPAGQHENPQQKNAFLDCGAAEETSGKEHGVAGVQSVLCHCLDDAVTCLRPPTGQQENAPTKTSSRFLVR